MIQPYAQDFSTPLFLFISAEIVIFLSYSAVYECPLPGTPNHLANAARSQGVNSGPRHDLVQS
jgi:hypothetical protein